MSAFLDLPRFFLVKFLVELGYGKGFGERFVFPVDFAFTMSCLSLLSFWIDNQIVCRIQMQPTLAPLVDLTAFVCPSRAPNHADITKVLHAD